MSRLAAELPPLLAGGGCGWGGLTISEDGGLEEFDESFRAAASGFCNGSTVAWSAAS
jgi:hypothetical protein